MQALYIVLIVLSIWLIALTSFLFYIFKFFKDLSKGVEKENLIKVLDKVLREQKITSDKIEEINKEIFRIRNDSQSYLQKVGILRFNPFEELGGDHSFSLAILDAKDSGFIITGLHTRERTRVYVKNVKKGKPEVELSLEEKKSLSLAQRTI